jgi:hypothetical protein
MVTVLNGMPVRVGRYRDGIISGEKEYSYKENQISRRVARP